MEIERDALKAAARSLKGTVSSRPGIPALTGWHVTYDGGKSATLTATDLETTTTVEVAATGSPVGALIPGKALATIVDKSKGDTLRIESAGDGKVKVGAARLRELPMGDFPNLPAVTEGAPAITANLADFTSAIEDTAEAVSSDQARPVLTGMLADFGSCGVTFVGTDSYRLHVSEVTGMGTAGVRALFDPKAIVAEAKRQRTAHRKQGGWVKLYVGDAGSVTAQFDNGVTVTTRGIDGEYPNWRQLIPDVDGMPAVTFEHGAMVDAVTLAAGLSAEAPLRFELNGSVIVRSSSPDLGDAEVEVETATFHGTAEVSEVAVGFHAAYLLGALKSTRAGRFVVRDGLRPAVMIGENRTALVMPVRLAL